MPTPTELLEMLTSPDPDVRDNIGYSTLARSIGNGELDGGLAELGNRIVTHLQHPEIQARTFAPLILDSCVSRDNDTRELDAETVRHWRDAFATWWVNETDLRGYDEKLGWLHAIAHGSDFLGALGTSRHLDSAALVGLLDLAVDRLTDPADYLYAHREDDRLAAALALVLSRDELDVDAATGWLERLREALVSAAHDSIRAWSSNTIRTLNSLYVVIDRGIRLYVPNAERTAPIVPPHRPEILTAIVTTLRVTAPHLA